MDQQPHPTAYALSSRTQQGTWREAGLLDAWLWTWAAYYKVGRCTRQSAGL